MYYSACLDNILNATMATKLLLSPACQKNKISPCTNKM